MAQQMLGLDTADCAAYCAKHIRAKDCENLTELCAALVQGQIDYLHACGALDETGDTGEGEYDEDDAVEYLLDALLRDFPGSDQQAAVYCALIDAFLPVFDDYLLIHGLLSL